MFLKQEIDPYHVKIQSMILPIMLFWLPMTLIAIFNVVIREMIFTRLFRELTCHQLFTLTLMILIGEYTWLIFPFLKTDLPSEAWLIGIVWFVRTLSFEFLAGHYIFKNSWERLFQDYNLLKGRIWGLFVYNILILPFLIMKSKTDFEDVPQRPPHGSHPLPAP